MMHSTGQIAGKRWDGSFALKIAGALAVIALADWLFFQRQEYMGPLGIMGLGLAAALLLTRPAVRRDRRSLIALGLAAVAAFAMTWDTAMLPFWLFCIAIGLATLLPGTAAFDDGWRWLQRLFVHGLKSLVGPLIDLARLARIKRRRPRPGKGARYWARTLAMPLLGSALILALFAAANPVIERFFTALNITPPDDDFILRLILWGFTGLLAWGVLRPRPPRRLLRTFDGRGDLAIPGFSAASVTIALVLFNLLFLAQNVMDSAFLWGAVKLPGDMTLADYAHRGAYPLVVTALLAALFVLVALRPGSQTAQTPLVRNLVLAWIGQNLFLVMSAALRTWDYVQSYDLTRLRIAALLWMGLVALGLVLVVVRMLRGKSAAWLINANLAAMAALLFPLSFIDTGTLAARWNLAHAREFDGTGAGLDWCYLRELGPSALVPLAEAEVRLAGTPLGDAATRLRWDSQQRLIATRAHGGWTLLGGRRLEEVHALLGSAADVPPPPQAAAPTGEDLCGIYRD